MQDLKITLIQSEVYWHQTDANLAMFEEKIWTLQEKTDLILLPEMFSTGFTMEVKKQAEPPNSKTYRWMTQMAGQTGALIMGSYIVKDGNNFYNRLHAVTPDGKHHAYDKRHLFRMADEHHYFSGGNKKVVVTWKGWKILPLVCYDLRFPVWSRNLTHEGDFEYDLITFVANWPSVRITAWDALLKARAIENLSYSAGLNRIGEDGNGIGYNGHSAVYDPKGIPLLFMEDKEDIRTVSISFQQLQAFRDKFPAHFDSDEFSLKY